MGSINVLSFEVANLIAAGEVVDRPASVIKELLENAIDAGATRVTVEIQRGGITFMRVADNGCGMTPEDLPVAIRRHATSKIKSAADLDGIATLGFRGEALAAIAAVSDLRIITRTEDAPFGTVLHARGGEVVEVAEQGAPVGTTVIVENLFANVPARLKFLKKDVSEAIAVSTYVEKIALSRPDIAIRLIVDGNLKLDTAGDGELRSAMYAVFGRDFATRMIEVSGKGEGIEVGGFIGRSDNVRPKRNYENFFINGRYVNCRTAAAALEQAYVSFIPPEKFPCCVLYININPAAVDVNVHPAKLEVKFSNERPVFEAVYSAVRTALEANDTRPEMKLANTAAPRGVSAFVAVEEGRRESLEKRQITMEMPKAPKADAFSRMTAADFRDRFAGEPRKVESPAPFDKKTEELAKRYPAQQIPPFEREAPTPAPTREAISVTPAPEKSVSVAEREAKKPHAETVPVAAAPEKEPTEAPTLTLPWRIIGEAFLTYVIVERGDELLVIDKHAAHERILFEKLRAAMSTDALGTQMMLVPIKLTLSSEDAARLEAFRTEIESIGFSFTAKAHEVDVFEIPEGLKPAEASELLLSLSTTLAEGTGSAALSRDIIFEKALYQGACKAAIKGGREYPPEYTEHLVGELMALPDITVCPHGRPVAMVLTHANIDSQFKR